MRHDNNAKRSRKFNSHKSAKSFADSLGVELLDFRGVHNCSFNFKVKYTKGDLKKNRHNLSKPRKGDESDWSPEDGRDFGYPNSYWKD